MKRHHTFRISRISRLCAALLLLLLLVPPAVSVFSAAAAPAVLSQEEAVINARSTDKDVSFTVASSVKLKSFATGDFEYTMYTLSPYGYAILCDETGALMEACYEESVLPPYPVNRLKSFYYGGPLHYFVLEKGQYREIHSQNMLTNTELDAFAALDRQARSMAFRISSSEALQTVEISPQFDSAVYEVETIYFSCLNDFGVNEEGTCTVIAAAILFGYYDIFINNAFVETAYRQGDGTNEAFHQLLNSYVYGSQSQGAIFIHDAAAGLNRYLAARDVTARLRAEYTSSNSAQAKILNELADGRPVIASMKKSLGAEWNHSVVVYRAVFDPANPLGTATLQMHCGWKDDTSHRSFVASISWFYECGYITAAVGKTTDCTHIYVPVPFAAKRSPNRIQPIGILCSANA